MLLKTGISSGENVNAEAANATYAKCVASALRSELGATHQAVKTVIRWTGAGERTVTNWLAGEHGPSGPHLALLAHHSDAVLDAFLNLAGRERLVVDFDIQHLKAELASTLAILERLSRNERT